MNDFGDSPATSAATAAPHASMAATEGRRRLRIWMVDDNAQVRESLAKLLNADTRFRVARQFDSVQPLLAGLAEERPPDIILLDLNIGKEIGLSAIQPARKLAPGVKILMLTTFNNTFAEEEAFKLGANGFLLKSYEPQEVAGLIYQSFNHPGEPRLFPNLAIRNAGRGSKEPKSTAASDAAERPGFFSALRQLVGSKRNVKC